MHLNRRLVAIACMSALTIGPLVLTAAPAEAAPKAKHYKNCKALNQVYPHGVGRTGAKDKSSGPKVTNFTRSDKVYSFNDGKRNVKTGEYDLDRDNDGIACEKK